MKKNIIMILMLMCIPLLASCDKKTNNTNNEDTTPVETTIVEEVDQDSYQYDGTLTVGPYTAYNENGTVIGQYPSMFQAIHHAGVAGKSTNKVYVLDANELEIFRRQAKNQYYMYDGDYFVGTASSLVALDWAEEKSRSYVLEGLGISYVKLGKVLMEGSNEPEHYELFSGGYNYMFSNSGVLQGGQWVEQGYGYATATVRLSEATYKPSEDGDGWNAYIFINHSGTYNSDLGLIGNVIDGEVKWRLVRNCSHESHNATGDNFKVLSSEAVTTMTPDENGVYSGADDLLFEVIATVNGWTLNITNLTTQEVYTIEDYHEGMHTNSTPYFRFLLSASYCPVVGDVWNSRNGGFLKNVIFENVKIARFNPENNYDNAELEDFYPGESTLNYGFSQGADTANHRYGVYESNGTYKSGSTYSAGSKYLIYNVYYDGSNGEILED